jgi:hypothetical protein
MGQDAGQIIVKTFVKTRVCEKCNGLRVSEDGKPHTCAGQKGRRAGAGQVIVIARHETTVSVTSSE